MPYSPKTYEEKPYNRCIDCVYIGKECDGPNFLAMTIDRWCEWCRYRKDYIHLTNAEIAERAGLSEVTVKRIIAGNASGLLVDTMQRVTKVLVNGTWGQYPCAMAAHGEPEEMKAAAEECKRLQDSIADIRAAEQRKIDHLKAQIDQQARLLQDRYEFLKQKDSVIERREAEIAECEQEIKDLKKSAAEDKRTRRLLIWLLSIAVVLVIALLIVIVIALIVDYNDPNRGYFWLDFLSAITGQTPVNFT